MASKLFKKKNGIINLSDNYRFILYANSDIAKNIVTLTYVRIDLSAFMKHISMW